MPVPLLPIVAAGATGLAGLSFASVLPEDDSQTSPPRTSTNPDSGGDESPEGIFNRIRNLLGIGGGGGGGTPKLTSLLFGVGGFLLILVFGNTIIEELL